MHQREAACAAAWPSRPATFKSNCANCHCSRDAARRAARPTLRNLFVPARAFSDGYAARIWLSPIGCRSTQRFGNSCLPNMRSSMPPCGSDVPRAIVLIPAGARIDDDPKTVGQRSHIYRRSRRLRGTKITARLAAIS